MASSSTTSTTTITIAVVPTSEENRFLTMRMNRVNVCRLIGTRCVR